MMLRQAARRGAVAPPGGAALRLLRTTSFPVGGGSFAFVHQARHQSSTPGGAGNGEGPSDTDTAATGAKSRSSRFVRSANASAGGDATAAADESGESFDAALAGRDWSSIAPIAHTRLRAPREVTTMGELNSFLQRHISLLRQNRHTGVRVLSQAELGKVVLPAIRGLDGNAVSLLLQALRLADMNERAPVMQDVANWLTLHAPSLPPRVLVNAMELLLLMSASAASQLAVSLLQRTDLFSIGVQSASRSVLLLAALLPVALLTPVTFGKSAQSPIQSDVNAPTESISFAVRSLRDYCSGAELQFVSALQLERLLRGVWSFRRNNAALYRTEEAASWVALEVTLCQALAAPDKTNALLPRDVITALDELQQCRKRQSACATTAAEAPLEHTHAALWTALLNRLAAETRAAQNRADDCTSAADILPPKWSLGDVPCLWARCLADTHTVEAYAAALRDLRGALVALIDARCTADPTNLAVQHTAALMCAEVLVAAMARTPESVEADTAPTGSDEPATAEVFVNLTVVLPESALQALLTGIAAELAAPSITWTATLVRDVVVGLGHSSEPTHRQQALELARRWYAQLQVRAQGGERLLPLDLLAFFTPTLLSEEKDGVIETVKTSLARWTVTEALYFFSEVAAHGGRTGGAESLAVLRNSGRLLCSYAVKASPAQLADLVECFGAAQVRNDHFCDVVAERLSTLLQATPLDAMQERVYVSPPFVIGNTAAKDTASEKTPHGRDGGASRDTTTAAASARTTAAPALSGGAVSYGVTLTHVTRLLRSLALTETRQLKPFFDAVPFILTSLERGEGTVEEYTQLIAAYAKMLIWNYPVLRALSMRIQAARPNEVTLGHLATAQLALLRMDTAMPALTSRFYAELTRTYASSPSSTSSDTAVGVAEVQDMVMHLSIVSRLHLLPSTARVEDATAEAVIARIGPHTDRLPPPEVAELLLSLSRLGKGRSPAFEALKVRTLGMLPRIPPRVMAQVVEAYALAGRAEDTELFTLVADRTISMRHEIAAVTIASVLSSFAKAGVRNDRLFIEVIPRVRHVATYGTPRDLTNVVSAYARVTLWHYKLFSRIAERAVQLRADFRVSEIVAMLEAFATVRMRYDRLFTEFAPRIQTLVHLLEPADLATIVDSYAQLDIKCTPVFKATAEQAVRRANAFTAAEARTLLEAYAMLCVAPQECIDVLTERFPDLKDIAWDAARDTTEEQTDDANDSSQAVKAEASQG